MDNLLELIKNKTAIRKYKVTDVPSEHINKILEAGLWGPSLHGIQPLSVFLVKDAELLRSIYEKMLKKSLKLYSGYNLIMKSSAQTVLNSNFCIVIGSNSAVKIRMKRWGSAYLKCGEMAEIQAVSAAAQNMMLMAEDLKIGSCWLTMPFFCANSIKKLLNIDFQVLAILSFGYPDERGARSKRKNDSWVIK